MLPAVESPARPLLCTHPVWGPSCLHIPLQHGSLVPGPWKVKVEHLTFVAEHSTFLIDPVPHPYISYLVAPEEAMPTAAALSKALAMPPWVTGMWRLEDPFPGLCGPLCFLTSSVLLDLALCLCYFTSTRLHLIHPACLLSPFPLIDHGPLSHAKEKG